MAKMGIRQLMKHVPGWVLAVFGVCLTIAFLGILGSLVYLSGQNVDTGSVMTLVNTALNFVVLLIAGTGTAAAAAAAKSAANAERQTNGEMTPRVVEAVHIAMDERENGNGGTEHGRQNV